MGIAEDFILIIVVGFAAGLIASRLKLPPILGYIVAGIAIGPHTGGITVTNLHDVELLAEIGVALLLFSIGLDFSLEELREVRNVSLIGGGMQIALSTAYGLGIGRLLGFSWVPSFLLGGIISLSSTMVVLKTLINRGLMGTLSSRVMIGILITQDLAAIPMMMLIPHLSGEGGRFVSLGTLALKAVVFLAVVILLGTRIIPVLFKAITMLRSRELFIVSVAAIGLGIGYATYQAGLSFAFGAFVAGMVLNRSDYSRQALSDIIPLRDVFSLIFFTSIGMLFDYSFVLKHFAVVIVLTALVTAGKSLIMFFVPLMFGYRNIIPIATALTLSQIGEFSFVLARSGIKSGVLDGEFYAIIIAVIVLTMMLTPFLAMLPTPLYSLKKRLFKKEAIQTYNIPEEGIREHVVIAGGGRIGSLVADVLASMNHPLVVIEQDFTCFERIKEKGHPTIFGDASQRPVIDAARVRDARIILVTIPNASLAREIIAAARELNPDIYTIVRTIAREEIEGFRRLRVNAVVQPEMEAGIEIVRRILIHLDVPIAAIQNCADEIRLSADSNAGHGTYAALADLKNAAYLLELEWTHIPSGSASHGKSIGDLRIRTATGASVVGIYRGGLFIANPGPDVTFSAGDIVAVIGTPESRKGFARLISTGRDRVVDEYEERNGGAK